MTQGHGAWGLCFRSTYADDFLCLRFGGGFELIRDGGDEQGVWSSFENGLQYVPLLRGLGLA